MSGDSVKSARPSPRITVALGLGQTLAFASSFYLLGVIGDAIAADLSMGPTFVVGLMSLALAVSPLVTTRVGRWIDARGGREVLLTSNLVFGIALALLAGAQGPATLIAAVLIMGLGMAIGAYATPFALLVSLYGDAARRPITAVALFGALGSAVGWPVTSFLQEWIGWRGACLCWAGAHLALCLPLNAWALPKHRPAERPHQDHHRALVTWDGAMIRMAVLFSGAWFISTAMGSHLPRLLAAFGLAAPQAAAIAGLAGLASAAVRLAEFTLARRLSPLVTTRAASLMHPLGAAALGAAGAPAAPLMALGHGAGAGMLTVAKGVLPLSLYGPANYAYRSALLSRPAQLVQIGGPALYGLVLAESPRAALALSAAVSLVMFAMTFGLRPHRKSHKEQAAA
jgi:predicted MFS family arabinose efflux permease